MVTNTAWSHAIVDETLTSLTKRQNFTVSENKFYNLLIFLKNSDSATEVLQDLQKQTGIHLQNYSSLPILSTTIRFQVDLINMIAKHPSVAQISLLDEGLEELEKSEQAILLKPSQVYPNLHNWWDSQITGANTVIGIIDSGIATDHPSLLNKNIVVRKEPNSGYQDYKNGVRTAHGTGVACIYAGMGSPLFPNELGIAYGASTIVTGLAGEGNGNPLDMSQTLSTLDWMLKRSTLKPQVINYSFGNGLVSCSNCSSWSGLAKIVDYVINQEHILWVKSAGNKGKLLGNQSMTIPADSYNALVVADMNTNPQAKEDSYQRIDRSFHEISASSSRGPTFDGRKKPDITAPGNDTWTCAPDPTIYSLGYRESMKYHDGYRYMGGTSAAAPHVGAAVLLLHQAGITSPLAQKALLINSADAWSDFHSDDSSQLFPHELMGSYWNSTYGWGYLNLQKAYEQQHNLNVDSLSPLINQKIYTAVLKPGDKITLVHERRVGYTSFYTPWQLSKLKLELIDQATNKTIDVDDSQIDTVHQVSNCKRKEPLAKCANTKTIQAIIRVTLNSDIDGSEIEPFAISSSELLTASLDSKV